MSDSIYLTADAYLEMLGHVLEYGNMGLKQTYDVLGICLGKLEGEKIVITKSIPVKHGPSVDRPFSEVDLIAINENIQTTPEQRKVGWYRSHGKMGFYMSQSDKKNQLVFQTADFPTGVFLTFDFEKISDTDPLGVKAFRLDNIAKGAAATPVEVPLQVEMPGMTVYKYLNKYICNMQKKEPLVKETGTQLDASEDLFSGGFGSEKKISEDLAKLKEYLATISSNENTSFFADFIEKVATFQEDLGKLARDSGFNNDNIVNLKESIEDGLKNVNVWMKEKMKELIEKNTSQISTTISDLEQSHQKETAELKKSLKSLTLKLEELKNSFK
jgi:hypothetical protein